MESTRTVVDRDSQPRVQSLGILLVFPLLLAIALSTPGVARHALLTITFTYTVIAAYWVIFPLFVESPPPVDLCQRCRRGLIARVAASRHGDRFYRCTSRGARYRRDSRDGLFVDASAHVYDAIYSRLEQKGLIEIVIFGTWS